MSGIDGAQVSVRRCEVIKKKGSKFQVTSSKGKPLGKPTTKKKAVKRLRQIEYFKSHPK